MDGETSSFQWLSLCHLGDNLQTAITVAKNSEMIPAGSQVIIVEANEPGDLVPASVTWQLVGTQEPGSGKKVSRCSKTSGWVWVGGAQPWHGATVCILEGILVTIPQVCHHAEGFQWHLADPATN